MSQGILMSGCDKKCNICRVARLWGKGKSVPLAV